MADTTQYKVGVVLSVTEKKGCGRPLKSCIVNVGEDKPINVVTSASNVRGGSRIVIAPVGSKIINEEGEEQVLKRTAVSGIMSEGMFCDARMLGWGDGSNGVAAQVPENFKPGMSPPKEKPVQKKKEDENRLPAVEVEPLFEKKLTKEEKKKLAEEKRRARKAAKEAKKAAEESRS